MITIKSDAQIERMAQAGLISAQALQTVLDAVCDGITTLELDRIAYEAIVSRDAIPAFLNYNGFPASVCISINDEIVHGIPSANRTVRNGDIVSVDIGAVYAGYVGDNADTVGVGEISEEAARLIETTRDAFWAGFEKCRLPNRLQDVSAAIQAVAEAQGFGVVREFVGHGIGEQMHEDPSVPNYGTPGRGVRLAKGMVIAIEPMVNAGDWHAKVMGDGWTTKTADGSLSAHYEHTVAITGGEPRILTPREETWARLSRIG